MSKASHEQQIVARVQDFQRVFNLTWEIKHHAISEIYY